MYKAYHCGTNWKECDPYLQIKRREMKLWQNEKWKYFDQANLVKQRCFQNFPGVETRQFLLPLLRPVSDVWLCSEYKTSAMAYLSASCCCFSLSCSGSVTSRRPSRDRAAMMPPISRKQEGVLNTEDIIDIIDITDLDTRLLEWWNSWDLCEHNAKRRRERAKTARSLSEVESRGILYKEVTLSRQTLIFHRF